MPLIECAECGATVSVSAHACPHCGFPVKKSRGRAIQTTPDIPRVSLTSLDVAKSILGRVVLAAGFFASGVGFEAPPVVILSVVLGLSGIPLWLKARKAERLGDTAGTAVIEERMGRALLEGEDRDMQQVADIEQNAHRIIDLEERLEFLERLLARHRDEQEKIGPGG